MPIISGVTFGGRVLPYIRTINTRIVNNSNPYNNYRQKNNLITSSDFAATGAYKQSRASRLLTAYSFYSKGLDVPTMGTIINIAF